MPSNMKFSVNNIWQINEILKIKFTIEIEVSYNRLFMTVTFVSTFLKYMNNCSMQCPSFHQYTHKIAVIDALTSLSSKII